MTKIESLLHRSAELARSGAYPDWTGVVAHLRDEGYEDAQVVLSEPSLRFQINDACTKAAADA